MSKKRDLLKEIQAKKERSEYNFASVKLLTLQLSFDARLETLPAINYEAGLYVVGIVACIEVAVRDAIRRLIDHGRPYIERIPQFKDVLRFDFDIVMALHDKRISFGDLVSHLLPVSNIGQIISYFEILFERDFKEVLAEIKEFIEPEFTEPEEGAAAQESEEAEPTLLPIHDVNALIASLGRLFRARHNAAHEADFDSVTDEELGEFLQAGETFIHALDEIVRQTIEPNMPRYAPGLAIVAAQEAGEAFKEMTALYEKATTLATTGRDRHEGTDSPTQAQALKEAQEAFEKYFAAETTSRGIYSSTLSGTGMRARDAHVEKELWAHRAQMLNELISDLEFDAEISSLSDI